LADNNCNATLIHTIHADHSRPTEDSEMTACSFD